MTTARMTKANVSMNKNFRDSIFDTHPELLEHSSTIGVAIRRRGRRRGRNVINTPPGENTLYIFGVSSGRDYHPHGWVFGADVKRWERARDLEEGDGREKWCVRDEKMRPMYQLYQAGYEWLGVTDDAV